MDGKNWVQVCWYSASPVTPEVGSVGAAGSAAGASDSEVSAGAGASSVVLAGTVVEAAADVVVLVAAEVVDAASVDASSLHPAIETATISPSNPVAIFPFIATVYHPARTTDVREGSAHVR